MQKECMYFLSYSFQCERSIMDIALNVEAFYRIFRDMNILVHSSTSLKEVMNLVVSKTTEVLKA